MGSTGACADEKGAADPPYTCACETGRKWNPESRQCDGEVHLCKYRLICASEHIHVVCKLACSRQQTVLVAADIDACNQTPCKSSTAGNVTCTDELAPALGDASGRTCSCGTGYVYAENTGCTGESALQPLLSPLLPSGAIGFGQCLVVTHQTMLGSDSALWHRPVDSGQSETAGGQSETARFLVSSHYTSGVVSEPLGQYGILPMAAIMFICCSHLGL